MCEMKIRLTKGAKIICPERYEILHFYKLRISQARQTIHELLMEVKSLQNCTCKILSDIFSISSYLITSEAFRVGNHQDALHKIL